MRINELRLNSFRNFGEVILCPDAPINLIYGDNGAGKSSLLEACYLLGFGRSFRTNRLNNLIQYLNTNDSSPDRFTIFLSYLYEEENRSIGFSRIRNGGNQINISGVKTSRLIDIARQLPVQLFTPQSSDLITGPPLVRRRYLDWVVFHVEHSFGKHINAYTKAVMQRNSILKKLKTQSIRSPLNSINTETQIWTNLLIEEGNAVNSLRSKFINLLSIELNQLYSQLFSSEFKVEIRYNTGWASNLSLSEAVINNTKRDLDYGYTTVGPHKADLALYVNGKNAAEYMSRGQLRLLVSLLLIAEINVLKKKAGKQTLILIDDIGAELEIKIRDQLIELMTQNSPQLLITAIDKQQFGDVLNNKNKKMFHVKHNQVYEE